MQIREALTQGAALLAKAEVGSPIIDAKAILKFILAMTDEGLLGNYDQELSLVHQQVYFTLVKRRQAHEPVAYIIGQKEFYSQNFIVNEHVLIPRNDSEILIDSICKTYPDKNLPLKILDIGTGSGCLILTLLNEYENAQGVALDISPLSLEVAELNARKLKLTHKVKFIESDLFSELTDRHFDLIISNPPYIASIEKNLMNSETNFEPRLALFAVEEGLYFYRKIAQNLSKYLKTGGRAFFEIGFRQQNKVAEIFQAANLLIESTQYDLEARPRCVVIKKVQND